jgi:serine protease Do
MDANNQSYGPDENEIRGQQYSPYGRYYTPPDSYRYRDSDPWTRWEQQAPKKRRRWVWLAILLVVAAVAAVISYTVSMVGNIWRTPYGAGQTAPYADVTPEYPRQFTGVDSIPRAPNGTGAILELQPAGTQVLTFQDIYKKAIPSVVAVEGIGDDLKSSGTGIIMTGDGYIITNYHIISGCSEVEITLYDESSYSGLLVGGDEQSDLAVLKIEASGLTPADFGHSDQLEVGDQVLAIGNPMGTELRGTMTDGIISAINRDIRVDGKRMTLLQTNAALNAGNSGGPLINMFGQVIGINIAKLSTPLSDTTATSVEGLGFSIPISSAKAIVDELIQHGYIAGRTAIGITAYGISQEEAAFYRTVAGLYVESVDNRSDAHAKGLRPGDIIVEANGIPITSTDELETAKADLQVGDTLPLRVYRDGIYLNIEVKLMDKITFSK